MGFSYAKTLLKDPHILNGIAFNPIPRIMGEISSNPTAKKVVDNTIGVLAEKGGEIAGRVVANPHYKKAAAYTSEALENSKKTLDKVSSHLPSPRLGASLEATESRARIAHALHASRPNIPTENISKAIEAARNSGEKSMALPLGDYARYRYTNFGGDTNYTRMAKDAGIAAGVAAGVGAAGYGATRYFGDD